MNTSLFNQQRIRLGAEGKMHENTVHQMAGKLTNDSRLPKNLTNCPTTNINVRGDDGTSFLIPDGQATWWRCWACQGWHVLIVDYMKK